MQLNTLGITFSLNAGHTTYSTATGFWTASNSSYLTSGVANYGRPTPVKFSLSSGSLPSGADVVSVYYLFFDTALKVAFGATFEDAYNNIPIIFSTSGSLFTVSQCGKTYNLKTEFSECCPTPLFDSQLPEPVSWNYKVPTFADFPKQIDFAISGITRSENPRYFFTQESDILAGLAYCNDSFDLYTGSQNNGGSEVNESYYWTGDANTKFLPYASDGATFASFMNVKSFQNFIKRNMIRIDFKMQLYGSDIGGWNIYYSLTIAINVGALADPPDGGGAYYSAISAVPTSGGIPDLSGIFSSIPTLTSEGTSNSLTGLPYYIGWPESISPTFSGSYAAQVFPATLTLTNIDNTYGGVGTRLGKYYPVTTYPTRTWTTNNYSSELPATVTLTKVVGHDWNYESEPFTTAVNVTNKIRLKYVTYRNGYFVYALYDRNFEDNGYYDSISGYVGSGGFQLVNTNITTYVTDGTTWLFNEPGHIQKTAGLYSPFADTICLLWRSSGIPYLESVEPKVSTASAFAYYYLEPPPP
jgi:hypothetical protein